MNELMRFFYKTDICEYIDTAYLLIFGTSHTDLLLVPVISKTLIPVIYDVYMY